MDARTFPVRELPKLAGSLASVRKGKEKIIICKASGSVIVCYAIDKCHETELCEVGGNLNNLATTAY
jgi:hypothetical protein